MIHMVIRNTRSFIAIKQEITSLFSDHGGISRLFIIGVILAFLGPGCTSYISNIIIENKLSLASLAMIGDAINPYISLFAALLVGIGLVYTVRDFRLARTEFEKSTGALMAANTLDQQRFEYESNQNRLSLLWPKIEHEYSVLEGFKFKPEVEVEAVQLINGKVVGDSLLSIGFKVNSFRALTELFKGNPADFIYRKVDGIEVTNRPEGLAIHPEGEITYAIKARTAAHLSGVYMFLHRYLTLIEEIQLCNGQYDYRLKCKKHRFLLEDARKVMKLPLFNVPNVYSASIKGNVEISNGSFEEFLGVGVALEVDELWSAYSSCLELGMPATLRQ